MLYFDFLSLFNIEILQCDPTGDFYGELHTECSILLLFNAYRFIFPSNSVCRAVLRNKFSTWCRLLGNCSPVRIIISGCRPSFMLKTRIVMFSMKHLITGYCALFYLPSLVRSNDFTCSVRICYFNLTHEAWCTVTHCRPMLDQIVEAVAENHSEDVLTLVYDISKIIGEIHDKILFERIFNNYISCIKIRTYIIICLVRRKILVTYAFSIDVQFKISQTSTIKSCFLYFLSYIE